MSDALTVNVYLQNNDYVKQLERDLAEALNESADWKRRYQILDGRYADIQHVNLELIDSMKLNGYKFRRAADVRTWGLTKGE